MKLRIFSTRKLLLPVLGVSLSARLSHVSEEGFLYSRKVIGSVWKFFFSGEMTIRCKIPTTAKMCNINWGFSEKNPLATNRCHKSRFSFPSYIYFTRFLSWSCKITSRCKNRIDSLYRKRKATNVEMTARFNFWIKYCGIAFRIGFHDFHHLNAL